ncbi:MAG TPA: hypothetical protein VFI25_14235 [Planctomycetota bacterium]|nr:hypothetical protein [Planctomycetota bacterium]
MIDGEGRAVSLARAGVALFLAGAVAFGSVVRIRTALADPNFDARRPEGMLKSDPGLLYYLLERVVESGGLPPEDFRADPRIEHPRRVDVPATFTVGEEFAVAWPYLLFGKEVPLHLFCTYAMAVAASGAVLGVFGLALELTRSRGWAAFAASLFCLLPANYRTIGFILVNEDFSLPWFSLHLFLLARAARVRTATSFVLAGASLAAAMATWHASAFLAAIEAACLFAWFLRTGANPFSQSRAWLVPAMVCVGCLLVPVLRARGAFLSLPMQLAGGMLLAAGIRRRGASVAAAMLGTGGLAALSLLFSKWTGAGIGDYAHVFELLWAKVAHLGRLPADPSALSRDARLLWQGPFETLDPRSGLTLIGVGAVIPLPLLVSMARGWFLGRGNAAENLLGAFALASLVSAWLVARTVVLAGLLLPVAAALAVRGLSPARRRLSVAAAALLLQGLLFAGFVRNHRISWYEPPERQVEIANLVRVLPSLVPEGEAVAADFMNSTAILAHTRRPIVFQPKWETAESRRRVGEFFEAFFHGSPTDLRRLLLEKYRCRYLLVDRWTLWEVARYAAGIPWSETRPRPGTAAEVFLSREDKVLAGVPGYRLLYRSPEFFPERDELRTDWFRLYEIAGT